jgi:hypothetical protein
MRRRDYRGVPSSDLRDTRAQGSVKQSQCVKCAHRRRRLLAATTAQLGSIVLSMSGFACGVYRTVQCREVRVTQTPGGSNTRGVGVHKDEATCTKSLRPAKSNRMHSRRCGLPHLYKALACVLVSSLLRFRVL